MLEKDHLILAPTWCLVFHQVPRRGTAFREEIAGSPKSWNRANLVDRKEVNRTYLKFTYSRVFEQYTRIRVLGRSYRIPINYYGW